MTSWRTWTISSSLLPQLRHGPMVYLGKIDQRRKKSHLRQLHSPVARGGCKEKVEAQGKIWGMNYRGCKYLPVENQTRESRENWNYLYNFLRRCPSPPPHAALDVSLKNVCGHKVKGLSKLCPCSQMVLNGSRQKEEQGKTHHPPHSLPTAWQSHGCASSVTNSGRVRVAFQTQETLSGWPTGTRGRGL